MNDTSRDPRHDGVEIIVVAGGAEPHLGIAGHLAPGATVVAADSGWDCARHLGLTPDLVVGDLDSISRDGLDAARRAGVRVEEHPTDKDSTDTELALCRAAEMSASRITVVAGGDRLDHLLGVLAALADPRWDSTVVRGFVGTARLHRVGTRNPVEIPTFAGATVSLMALGGGVDGVTTSGLRWALSGERLEAWQSRGLSNVATHDIVNVRVASGTLLVIEPDFLASPRPARTAGHENGHGDAR